MSYIITILVFSPTVLNAQAIVMLIACTCVTINRNLVDLVNAINFAVDCISENCLKWDESKRSGDRDNFYSLAALHTVNCKCVQSKIGIGKGKPIDAY